MSSSRNDLDELFGAVCDGRATRAQQGELARVLSVSPEARDRYLHYVDLHACLTADPPLILASARARPLANSLCRVGPNDEGGSAMLPGRSLSAVDAVGSVVIAVSLFCTIVPVWTVNLPQTKPSTTATGAEHPASLGSAVLASGDSTGGAEARVARQRLKRLLPPPSRVLGRYDLHDPIRLANWRRTAGNVIHLMPAGEAGFAGGRVFALSRPILPPRVFKPHKTPLYQSLKNGPGRVRLTTASTGFGAATRSTELFARSSAPAVGVSWRTHVQSQLKLGFRSLAMNWRETDEN